MYRQTTMRIGPGKITPGVKWVLIVTTGFFVLQYLTPLIEVLFVLKPFRAGFMPWQPISYMFMHGGFFHILFNMFGIWMFGTYYEQQFGTKNFLSLYFISGVGAGIIYLLFMPFGGLLGASAGVYAIFVSFAYFWPNAEIYFLGIFPIRAKYLILIMMAFGVLSSIRTQAGDNTAHFAHLMGAVIGFLYLQIVHRRYAIFGSFFQFLSDKTERVSTKRKEKKQQKKEQKKEQKVIYKDDWVKDKVDDLLDKVSRDGLGSLTRKEKDFLDKVSMDYNSKSDD